MGIPNSDILGVTMAAIHVAVQQFLAVSNGLNPKMDMGGPSRPQTTSNGCSTLTIIRPAKIFYAMNCI